MKWKILKPKEAHKFGMKILRAGPERYLEIDLCSIPDGMSIDEFIDFVEKAGIVMNVDFRKYKRKRNEAD